MGLSSSKSKSSTKPVYGKEIMSAANTLNSTYQQQAPKIAGYADQIGELVPSLLDRYKQGDPAVIAARNYVTSTLDSDPTANPYLDDMVSQTNDNVRNQLQARMGTRGQTGSSDYYGIIGKGLAQNETGLRYADYDRSMDRKAQAAGMAPGVVAGDLMTLAPAFSAIQLAAGLPMNAASQFAAGTGGLLGQYTNTEQKSSPSIMQGLGQAAQIAAIFCDARLKENATLIETTPGGVPIYTFNYIGDDTLRVGPMAQEVAEIQPNALGPVVNGFMTVNFGDLH